MQKTRRLSIPSILIVLGVSSMVGIRFVEQGMVWSAAAQTAAARSEGTSGNQDSAYALQRSIRIDNYNLVTDNGPERGEVLYFFKCWMCHNQYTIRSEYGEAAPFLHLRDLYQRPALLTGEPVNDRTVANKIRNGGTRMPAFGATLSDADISDLVSYLRGGNCCLEGENPPANPWYRAETNPWSVPASLSGGPRGMVRLADGQPLEGIPVQLVAPNAVRTTVYSNEEGSYQFPRMQAGTYTLRVPTPLEFQPYQRDSVPIQGADAFEDIVLEGIASPETDVLVGDPGLPPTPEIFSQLTGAEILWNLPGTAQEKSQLHRSCGSGCHDFQRIFRNRFDERSWRLIVERMFHYRSRTLINRVPGATTRGNAEQEELLVKWLAKVRGPQSEDAPLRIFPRPRRAATRAVVTEYELPRVLLSPHDVAGDAEGNIWYTSHKTPYVGKLDPRTGIITEYQVPLIPGAMPGTHAVKVDARNNVVWFSENWAHYMTRFDPRTEEFTQFPYETNSLVNSASGGNFGLGPDGSLYNTQGGAVVRMDPQTTGSGRFVDRWPLAQEPRTYDNLISDDGRFWSGGGPASGGQTIKLLDLRTGELLTVETPRRSSAARGGFDREGNPWYGGRGGSILTLNAQTGRIREYWPPTPYSPYTQFYEAMPDKNGEVWAAVLHGRSFLRLNPRTERWIEYVLPEPFANNYRTWIDNSTDPVSVWYVDYKGYIVRIQPRE